MLCCCFDERLSLGLVMESVLILWIITFCFDTQNIRQKSATKRHCRAALPNERPSTTRRPTEKHKRRKRTLKERLAGVRLPRKGIPNRDGRAKISTTRDSTSAARAAGH